MLLQVCDPTTNDYKTWINVKGLVRFRIVRSGGSMPSTLTAYVAANSEEEDGDLTKARFWPFQGIRIIETDGRLHDSLNRDVPQAYDVMYFAGRIDSVYLKEDDNRGRMWEINARCWLGLLADNTIGNGRWVSGLFESRKKNIDDNVYKPNYNQYYGRDEYPYGEFRRFIIWDLAMNIVASYDNQGVDNLLGIERFWYSGEGSQSIIQGIPGAFYENIGTIFPNSLPISVEFNDKKQTILQAIQILANSDPWCDGLDGGLNYDIDSVMLAGSSSGGLNIKFPSLENKDLPLGTRRGIGGDLQMQMRTLEDNAGRTAEYIPKGWQFTGFYAYYGKKPEGREGTKAYAIVEMDFGKDGLDVYTAATAGDDGSIGGEEVVLSGTGLVTSTNASEWDPTNNKFRTVKTKRLNLTQISDDLDNMKGGEETAAQARLSLDAASAEIFNTTESANGGIYRGTITYAGRPKSLLSELPIRPSEIIKLHIPQLGINWSPSFEYPNTPNTSSDFVVEQWSFEWPDDKTVIEVTRPHPGTLLRGIYNTFQAAGVKAGWEVSDWFPVWKCIPPPNVYGNPQTFNQFWYDEYISAEWYRAVNPSSLTGIESGAPQNMVSIALPTSANHYVNTSVQLNWAIYGEIDTEKGVSLEFGIWDGFSYPKFTRAGRTGYLPIPETVRKFKPTANGGSIEHDKNKGWLRYKVPAVIQDHVSWMTPEAWDNVSRKWHAIATEAGLPPVLPYPVDPNRPGWITRDTPYLLIRMKAKRRL